MSQYKSLINVKNYITSVSSSYKQFSQIILLTLLLANLINQLLVIINYSLFIYLVTSFNNLTDSIY